MKIILLFGILFTWLIFPSWSQITPTDTLSNDEIFLMVEESAVPVGGIQKFYEHIAKTIRYPVAARRKGIEGKVFVEFVINRDGSISDVKAIKGIGGGCNEEAVRVVASSPPWTPARQRGKVVRQRYVAPIQFQLTGVSLRKKGT